MLAHLLHPLDKAVSRGGDATTSARESLPNVARIAAELILQLPRSAPRAGAFLTSIDGAIDDMLAVAKVLLPAVPA